MIIPASHSAANLERFCVSWPLTNISFLARRTVHVNMRSPQDSIAFRHAPLRQCYRLFALHVHLNIFFKKRQPQHVHLYASNL